MTAIFFATYFWASKKKLKRITAMQITERRISSGHFEGSAIKIRKIPVS